jgi:hypothetical protein
MFESSPASGPYDGLLLQDPSALADRARGLQERRDRLDAEEAELLIEIEVLRAKGRDYFRDTAAWLRQNTGIARSTARVRSHVARQLAALPAARVAWSEGRIGFDHARVLADHADSPHRDNLLDQQDEIVGWAVALDADAFRDRMGDWARDLDETRDKALSPVERQRRRRKVTRSRTKDGLHRTVLELDEEPTPSSTARCGTPRRRCNALTGRRSCRPDSSGRSVSSWPTPPWRWPAAPGARM